MKKKPSYQSLIKKRQKIIAQIEAINLNYLIRGNIRQQYNICARKGCKCIDPKNPQPHGPYFYLSFRGKGKNNSIFLTAQKLRYARQATRNYKTILKAVIELSEINFKLLRYYKEL